MSKIYQTTKGRLCVESGEVRREFLIGPTGSGIRSGSERVNTNRKWFLSLENLLSSELAWKPDCLPVTSPFVDRLCVALCDVTGLVTLIG